MSQKYSNRKTHNISQNSQPNFIPIGYFERFYRETLDTYTKRRPKMDKPKSTHLATEKNIPLTIEEANMLRKALSWFEDDTPFWEYCEEMKALKAKKNHQQSDFPAV